MPFAVVHILIPILVLQFASRFFAKVKSVLTWKRLLIAGFFGAFPDADAIISFFAGSNLHRTFTHSYFAPLLVLVLAVVLKKWRIGILFAGFGWFMHVTLDLLVSGTLPIFYPIETHFGFRLLVENASGFANILTLILFDATVLAVWVLYNKKLIFRKRKK